MKKIRLLWAALAAIVALSVVGTAWAQGEEAGVRYASKTVIDFNDVTLEGELTKPEGAYLLDRKRTKFRSLISLRTEFLSELQSSVDNL